MSSNEIVPYRDLGFRMGTDNGQTRTRQEELRARRIPEPNRDGPDNAAPSPQQEPEAVAPEWWQPYVSGKSVGVVVALLLILALLGLGTCAIHVDKRDESAEQAIAAQQRAVAQITTAPPVFGETAVPVDEFSPWVLVRPRYCFITNLKGKPIRWEISFLGKPKEGIGALPPDVPMERIRFRSNNDQADMLGWSQFHMSSKDCKDPLPG